MGLTLELESKTDTEDTMRIVNPRIVYGVELIFTIAIHIGEESASVLRIPCIIGLGKIINIGDCSLGRTRPDSRTDAGNLILVQKIPAIEKEREILSPDVEEFLSRQGQAVCSRQTPRVFEFGILATHISITGRPGIT